ncbi:MAG: hypothetical protein Q8922_14990 [Bacteroidota bacterium]|nr:hypothetical protein [Bacteroidota bacterium]MDP4234132.1 hypothetical protein [Bacteroidota bacterium]MDP4244069.1 hypothetical protein [Bacteroidota bacterium]MDP4289223.1 hypothetical protein [Bacteroidota bacterium]
MDPVKLRKYAALVLLGLVGLGCHRSGAPGSDGFHPYGIRHAHLHFEYFGNARGNEDLWFDSLGVIEARWTHSDFGTDKGFQTSNTYTVKHRAQVTIVDSMRTIELHILDARLDSMYHLQGGDVPDPEQVFREYFSKVGYHLIGDTIVCGLHAKKWQQGDQMVYLLESDGLIVGSQQGPIGVGVEFRLISADTVSAIDPSRFVATSNYPIQNIRGGSNRTPTR